MWRRTMSINSDRITSEVHTTLHDIVEGAAAYGEIELGDVRLERVEVQDSKEHTVKLVISGRSDSPQTGNASGGSDE